MTSTWNTIRPSRTRSRSPDFTARSRATSRTTPSQETIGGNSYSVTRPRSTHDGYLEGAEVNYQEFFTFLPDPFKGLGIQANYTYIKGETQSPLTLQDTPLAEVSKNNYNLVLIYEEGAFSSRLAHTWRDKFIDSFNQPGLQPTTVWVLANDRLDFSASYDLSKNVTLTFDATNIPAPFRGSIRQLRRSLDVHPRHPEL